MTKLLILTNLTNRIAGNNPDMQELTGTWIFIMISAALLCFIVSEITRNYSQVDKLWSIMPVIYSLITLFSFPSPRIILMSILVIAWGIRLSYNFGRKGGYNIIPWKGEEDYRWSILRQNPVLKGRLKFGLFNLFFISFYQQLLILLFSTPLLIAAKYSSTGLNMLDIIATMLILVFLTIETIADNQLFSFHSLKKRGLREGLYSESLKRGFMSEGIWRYSRHPNFASEQAIWISFYLFSVASSGILFNSTITGASLLVLLFAGSTAMTEKISSGKYPAYEEYSKTVPKFIPDIFRLPFLQSQSFISGSDSNSGTSTR
jgi:steroid 5-alpha reductase family enzyme